jgi:DNA polymerase-3 subunit epsilon
VNEDVLLYRCLAGSRAHGTSGDRSDVDIRGVFAAPRDMVLSGLSTVSGQARPMEKRGEGDSVLFELTRFAKCIANQETNALEWLWAEPKDVTHIHPGFVMLRAARAELLSQKVLHSFGGFAKSTVERANKKLERGDRPDPKELAAAVRLLRSATEILEEGTLRVRRPDAQELIAIRKGTVPAEQVLEQIRSLSTRLGAVAAKTGLPKEVDQGKLAALVARCYDAAWNLVPYRKPPRHAGNADVAGRVCVVDIEGTGFGEPDRFRIVELAAVEIEAGRLTGRTFHAFVDPQGPVNPYATRIHGLTSRFLKGKPVFRDIAEGFLEFVGSSQVVMHDAMNDVGLLDNDLTLAGLPPFGTGGVTCSLKAARHLLGKNTLGLDSVCERLGIDLGPRNERHSALVDAKLTAEAVLCLSAMPDWGTATYDAKAPERLGSRPRFGQDRPVASLTKDGTQAVFTFADGSSVMTALPPFPPETHEAVANGSRIEIRQREGAQDTRPRNPSGPSIVKWMGGGAWWFDPPSDGKEEPSPGPGPG